MSNCHEHNFVYKGRDDMYAILFCSCGASKLIEIEDWLDILREEENEDSMDDDYGDDPDYDERDY